MSLNFKFVIFSACIGLLDLNKRAKPAKHQSTGEISAKWKLLYIKIVA
jgi:hypothetical protein